MPSPDAIMDSFEKSAENFQDVAQGNLIKQMWKEIKRR